MAEKHGRVPLPPSEFHSIYCHSNNMHLPVIGNAELQIKWGFEDDAEEFFIS